MGDWLKTSCTLCTICCGLEVQVENNRIVRVRPDKDNPRSKGYCCRKGRGIRYFQHSKDRLLYPMKRMPDGNFVRISWDQALTEICARVKEVVDAHGPRAFACQGLGGFLGQLHTLMAKSFMGAVGSQYHFRALAAELTGFYWSCGVMLGNQTFIMHPDEEESDVFVAAGWNPYVGHNMVQGKRIVHEFSVEPKRTLVVIDPRRSETARMADYHLAIRPGTDAVLWRAMLALVIQEKWYNQEYIEKHVTGFEKILPWVEGVDVRAYCEFCELDYDLVREVTELLAKRESSLHSDLGVICGRHSTLVTHIQNVFLAICGRLLVKGGNCFINVLIPGTNNQVKDADKKFWRLNYSNFPQIFGIYPTALLGEEIDNDTPNRVRALFCVNSNPLRSVVNTVLHEKALAKLDLLVTVDCALTETARASDYILPSATGYEVCEINTMAKTYPYIYQQLRQPVVTPECEILDGIEVWVRMLETWGALPQLPESLYEAARGDRKEYATALKTFLEENPDIARFRLAIIARTLGKALGSMGKAVYWAMLQTCSERMRDDFARAGYARGPDQLETIFDEMLKHPEGLMVAKMDVDTLFDRLETEDKRIHLHAPELDDWIQEITPEAEGKILNNPDFPYVLNAGRHIETNINHTMRDPAWIKGKADPSVLTVNPKDAEALGIVDGQTVRVVTLTGQVEIAIRISRETRPGSVLMPHGHGFIYDNKVQGVNVNMLTDTMNRDRLVGTPFHHYEVCRIEPIAETRPPHNPEPAFVHITLSKC